MENGEEIYVFRILVRLSLFRESIVKAELRQVS
jgi:hypothetical protein